MKTRALAGSILIFVSLAFFGGGGFIIKQAVDEKARQAVQRKETEAQCQKHLESIPGAKVRTAGTVTLTLPDVTNPMEALSTASMAIMMCPTRDVASICLGDRCASSGNDDKAPVALVLTLANLKE
jgi:hypothetical protein